ncbi:MAG: alpha-L-fucosidase [Lachnospiraceae bacterium]|nr:alpha-L-fucosidase [Lachnospiraceae bacterium]
MNAEEKRAIDERLVKTVPSDRQVEHQKTEFYAFVHFTVNTFTDREWGDGTEDPAIFNPVKFDASQWVSAIKDAGMKGLILTCKHHDGFCLWPSKYTDHSVAFSPFKRDIVSEVSKECRKQGIKFGFYLSPWDRNSKLYGTGKAYDDYFVSQLTELLTGYGEIFSVWFDGACGEGENGKKQYYDWERYYETVRKYQPGACITICGPDVRWCGNEAGHTRKSEWSVVPARTRDTEKIASLSQQKDDTEFRNRKITAKDQNLGSRNILANERDLVWYPAEVNTSIRPGWFWHESENDKVRSLEELMGIYNNSVGGNATFLLNIPPTNEGLFHENDVKRLHEIGEYLRKAFSVNLIEKAKVTAGTSIKELIFEDNYEKYWCGKAEGRDNVIEVNFEKPEVIRNIVIKENIKMSQRVESFFVEARTEDGFKKVYDGTVIGYKRIIPFGSGLKTDALRIVITDSRLEPVIAFLGVYEQ